MSAAETTEVAHRDSLPPRSGLSATRFALALVSVALAASAFAIAFRLLLSGLLELLYGEHDVVSAFAALPAWARIVCPAVGGVCAGATTWLARRVGPRRAGDPPALVASPEKALRVLGWKATQSDIDNIISTAWAWHHKQA